MKKAVKFLNIDKALMLVALMAVFAIAYQVQAFFVIEQQVDPSLIYASDSAFQYQ
ncbi:hypothetical protein [Sneathiella glossodoripedis]|uniref:hypothetical protein n=1 Tax=Sneathiella glossodoripedis TaxID=418853 RepID=UPI00131F3FE6|nr:hypothetical protein [Sneathiella glossodoripedis]